ncbi:hypothetical protein SSX86_029861 [Deinandra increscens subsp. villosa]|uniref:SH3 domain-containing protein n=1 Tax=Deinandra increscens subsp. villosa TaxID=3103831 RepID=A0AAP0CHC0_9ASTR
MVMALAGNKADLEEKRNMSHAHLVMLQERQRIEVSPTAATVSSMSSSPPHDESKNTSADNMDYFLGEVIHPYQAESDAELSLTVGEYVVVRKVSSNGWAEGECDGKAGLVQMRFGAALPA